VVAQGKHLFIELDDGRLLRSHLGLYGSWHHYAPGESWRKPARQAAIELETDDAVYVCFNAREVELLRGGSVRERIVRTRLGPDLTSADPALDLLPARAREFLESDTLVADVLLDQRVACGIGNVYKSEVLFLERVDPLAPLGDVEDEALDRLYATAHELLRRNLGGGPRTTRFERDGAGRLWVYGRSGLPCLRCGTAIAHAPLGRAMRATFWCPDCQSKNP